MFSEKPFGELPVAEFASGPTTLGISGTAGGGIVGLAYSATFAASGGAGPYTFSLGSGTLPAGLTLHASTGVLDGTPTTQAAYTFVIHVHDSTSGTPLVADSSSQSVTIAATLSIVITGIDAAAAGVSGVCGSVFSAATDGKTPLVRLFSFGRTGNESTSTLTFGSASGGTCGITVPVPPGTSGVTSSLAVLVYLETDPASSGSSTEFIPATVS